MHSVLAGRYRLERQLGKGGMGSVWLAEHLALRSWVAVKLMDPAIAATPEGAERFRREAMAAASLRSAHVVQVLDYGVHETTPYLVMELLNGESLAGCLEREKRLAPERTVTIMTQVARALGRAHAAGIVHRDLKPDNVFLVREDDQELVKILDFGIAKTPASTFGGMETKTGVTMGTPYYMSPEQVEGKKAVDLRTDLWAMAVITCECMTGVRPFDGSTYGELLLNICARPIAPPSAQGFMLRGFDEWFAKATSRDAEQRFGSAQELVNALRDVVAGHATAAALPSAVVPSGQPAYFPSGTGQSAAPSVSSMNTSQAVEELRIPTKASPLPWILLGAVLLVGGIGAVSVLLRNKPTTTEPAAERSAAVIASPPASQEVAPLPAPEPSTPAPPASPTKAPVTAKTQTVRETPAPPMAAKPPTAQRCYNDPFSGQLRPASGVVPGGASTFGCKQDPFTGKYKRL
ncbi:MAG: putative serine/threonine-protein kinase pknH [Polyangiaceae bacterium]|jgi:serine/threonine-protein kinase|nr:putative serine/threonine-protein kinase pknH [Polyangiaceae bacterium]